MISFRVKVGRAAEVARKFGNFRGNKIMADEFGARKDRVRQRLTKYPSERPKQRYRRRGTQGARWSVTARLSGNGAELVASNDTQSVHWTQNKPTQAWMHKDRWETAQDIMASEEQPIKAGITRRSHEALK